MKFECIHILTRERNWLMKKARNILHTRDGYKCIYCGSSNSLHIDHIKPKYIYNNHKISNLVTACMTCNFKKAGIPLCEDEFNRVSAIINERNAGLSLCDIRFVEYICAMFYAKRKPKPITSSIAVIDANVNVPVKVKSDIVDVHIDGNVKRGYIVGRKIRIPSPEWGLISKSKYKYEYVQTKV